MFRTIRKRLFLLIGIIIILNFFSRIYFFREDIFKNFDSKYWGKRYGESQWATFKSTNPIGDDGLYAFAGYRYALGMDPSIINAEIPPFGKYLIGFFEIATGRMGIFSLFFYFLSLVSFYLLNSVIFKSKTVALIPILILSFDQLFFEQVRAPFLDSLLLSSLLLSLYFFVRKDYWIGAICAGVFMASKSPFLGIILFVTYLVYLFLIKHFSFRNLSFLILPVLVYVLSYVKSIYDGGIVHFLQIQKYILNFYATGVKGITGAVFPLLFFGYWQTWWDQGVRVDEWTFVWPVAFILSVYAIYLIFKNKIKGGLLLMSIWVVLYVVFLVFTPVFPRYLLLLLPFMYNLSIWVLFEGTGWTSRLRS